MSSESADHGKGATGLKLSVVMPVYNEAATIERIVERVLAVELPMERELVMVDDGSTDGTRDRYEAIQKAWPDTSIVVKLCERNRGKGAALREGFALASGDIILVQDADLEYDPSDYSRLLAPILTDKADVVYGSRFVGSEAHRVLYFWHMIGNRFLTLFSNMMTNLNLTDMETCYKVFRSEVIKPLKLKSDRFTIEPEMTAKVAKGRWRIFEVGISYAGRTYEEGKKIGWKDAVAAMIAIVRFRLMD